MKSAVRGRRLAMALAGVALFVVMRVATAQTRHPRAGPLVLPEPAGALPRSTFQDPVPHHWISAEELSFWLKDQPVPVPLITAGAAADPAPGAIGSPGTRVLLGNEDLSYRRTDGIRLSGGWKLDGPSITAIEVAGFCLDPARARFRLDPGAPVIARPFFDAVGGVEQAELDAFPGFLAGGARVTTRGQLWGFDVDVVGESADGPTPVSHEWIAGVRFLKLSESLRIDDEVTALVDNVLTFEGRPLARGQTLADFDRFATSNEFVGLQVGGRLNWRRRRLRARLEGRVAVGTVEQQSEIDGVTTLLGNGGLQSPGGVLAQRSNIGITRTSHLAVVPQLSFLIGLDLSPRVLVHAGYELLYWDRVARPGDQIDRRVTPGQIPSDPSFGSAGPQLPGPSRPRETDFWCQGLTGGVTLRF